MPPFRRATHQNGKNNDKIYNGKQKLAPTLWTCSIIWWLMAFTSTFFHHCCWFDSWNLGGENFESVENISVFWTKFTIRKDIQVIFWAIRVQIDNNLITMYNGKILYLNGLIFLIFGKLWAWKKIWGIDGPCPHMSWWSRWSRYD